MEVDELFQRIVRRHGVMLFLLALVAGVMAGLVRFTLPIEYSSVARVVLRPTPPQSAAEAQTAADEAAALVTSDSFLANALKEADRPSGIDERKLVHVSVSALGTSGVAEINATYTYALAVKVIAQSLATQYIALQTSVAMQNVSSVLDDLDSQLAALNGQIGQLEGRLRATPPGPGADVLRDRHLVLMNQRSAIVDQRNQVTSQAALTKVPVLVDTASVAKQASTHWAQDAGLGGLLGLVVGLLVAAIREIVSPSLVGRRAVAKALGVPLLGYLPGPPWSEVALESKETRDIAASAFLLADSQKLDWLELLGVGSDKDVSEFARRLNQLVDGLQPVTPERQTYPPFLAALSQPRTVRRFTIGNFADERRPTKPIGVLLVAPTSLPAADVEHAKDLVNIGSRRILGVISYRKTAHGRAPTPRAEERVRVIGDRSRSVRAGVGEA